MMLCAITGRATSEPVFSPITHLVYDRTTLLLALDRDDDKCPVTGTKMERNSLMPVKMATVMPPRTAEATSIPNLLQMLESEWDACALETFKLRNALEQQRKETALALYELDAAKIVIQRLYGELQDVKNGHHVNNVAATTTTTTTTKPVSLPESDANAILTKSQDLVSMRKKRKTQSVTTANQQPHISQVKLSYPKDSVRPATTCMDARGDVVVMGHVTGSVSIWSNGTFVRDLTPTTTTPPPTACVAVQVVLNNEHKIQGVVAMESHNVNIWWGDDILSSVPPPSSSRVSIPQQAAALLHLKLHPTNQHALICQVDGSWSLIRLHDATIILSRPGSCTTLGCGFDVHPDGILLAVTGEKPNTVEVWSLTSTEITAPASVLQLNEQTGGGVIDAIAFCENGTSLLCGFTAVGKLDVINLRNQTVVRSFALQPFSPRMVRVERGGGLVGFLSVLGKELSLMDTTAKNVDEWKVIGQVDIGASAPVDVVFNQGQYLVTDDGGSVRRVEMISGQDDDTVSKSAQQGEIKKKRG